MKTITYLSDIGCLEIQGASLPGKDGGGFFMTILLGIVGAVVGGWISTLFGFGKVDGFNFGSFVVAVIGAIVVLFIYRKIKS
ncbi:GlsB/YeaQ/YmgE family stress response membrane protein [Escherichia coli]|uniref:GlsB/YeaQ/YmgE family stress response membrane protein n=1 Tax=Escherichia coli TaxID=562 RepID=UPI003D067A80